MQKSRLYRIKNMHKRQYHTKTMSESETQYNILFYCLDAA